MSELKTLLTNAKLKRWCTRIPCTTCGCREFRDGLESITAEHVICGLGELDTDEFYVHSRTIEDVFKWLRFTWAVSDPADLEPIRGSVAWGYFNRKYDDYKQAIAKRDENIRVEAARQAEIRKAKASKASYDLIGAIYRGDEKGVKGLLAKGADPDMDRGHNVPTARQSARQLGREYWLLLEQVGEKDR